MPQTQTHRQVPANAALPPPQQPSLPEPPHVAVLVGEEAVGVIAAVLDVLEAAAVYGAGIASHLRAAEAAHQHPVGVEVAAALGAHRAVAGLPAASAPAAHGREGGGEAAGGARAEQAAAGSPSRSSGTAARRETRPEVKSPAPSAPPRQRRPEGQRLSEGLGSPSALGPKSRREFRELHTPVSSEPLGLMRVTLYFVFLRGQPHRGLHFSGFIPLFCYLFFKKWCPGSQHSPLRKEPSVRERWGDLSLRYTCEFIRCTSGCTLPTESSIRKSPLESQRYMQPLQRPSPQHC